LRVEGSGVGVVVGIVVEIGVGVVVMVVLEVVVAVGAVVVVRVAVRVGVVVVVGVGAILMNEIVQRKDTAVILFDDNQKAVFERIMGITDTRNKCLDWRQKDHNTDFCLIKGRDGNTHIEAVKDFHLKAMFVAEVSMRARDPIIVGTGKDIVVTVGVTVWKGEREVTAHGGSTVVECGYPKNGRAFHDAVARAQTRAMKIAMEEFMGMPFVNMFIEQIFGGYEVTTPKDAGATVEIIREEAPTKIPAECAEIKRRIKARMDEALSHGWMLEVEYEDWRPRLNAASSKKDLLAQFEVAINQQIDRGKRMSKGEKE
jgi:hypothetical protein